MNESKEFLLSAKSGYEGSKLEAARSHSYIIGQNYVNFLADWKDSVLDKNEAIEFDKIFREKLMDDSRFTKQIKTAAEFLKDAATQIYDFIIANRITEAIVKHQDYSQIIEPELKKFIDEWTRLKKLDNDFKTKSLSKKL